MRRQLQFAIALALLAGLLTLAPPGSAAVAPPRAQLRGFLCQPALDPPARSVAVMAVMRPLPATRKLQLKFDLLATRDGSLTTSTIHAGNLGIWLSPRNPTLGQLPGDVWEFQKSVVELGVPASYRFRVAFRWIGANDQVIGAAVRYSRHCHQRELRPDLLVQAPIVVMAIPSQTGEDLYSAVIRNAGATAAGPFLVEFVPADGSMPTTDAVARLDPYQSRTVTFVGPLCTTAGPPTIIADSTAQVDDLSRANNILTAVCPASGPSASRRNAFGLPLH